MRGNVSRVGELKGTAGGKAGGVRGSKAGVEEVGF